VHSLHASSIIGSLVIGTAREHEYTPAETQVLEEVANVIAAHLDPK
jgi:hypothetical protein